MTRIDTAYRKLRENNSKKESLRQLEKFTSTRIAVCNDAKLINSLMEDLDRLEEISDDESVD
ncbi:MAG: hypothetical protein RR744_08710 [Cellulosilyticaceae bacterium]